MIPIGRDTEFILFHAQLESEMFDEIAPEITSLLQTTGDMFAQMADIFNQYAALVGKLEPSQWCLPEPPISEDRCHPPGSLQVKDDVITTPGGYQIEVTGQFDWKITSPDGESWTEVKGDPHVHESDRADEDQPSWDFRFDSTFLLPDATKINVDTELWGDTGMTVTKRIEVISGSDRVIVSDINQSQARTGLVTQDGQAHEYKFFGEEITEKIDVFAMGQEADDWSFEGREITGSKNGGESFITGRLLAPLTERTDEYGGVDRWSNIIFEGVMRHWTNNWQPFDLGHNPYRGQERRFAERTGNRTKRPHQSFSDRHVESMRQAFQAMGGMLTGLSRLSRLNEQVALQRQRSLPV